MNLLQEIHNGNLDGLKEKLEELGVPKDQEYTDYVLLRYALWRGNREIAKFLIEKGCRFNKKKKTLSNTPLHIAIKHEDIDIVKLLLEKGASIESINHSGETPLHFAAKTKNDLIIHKVLESINPEKHNGIIKDRGGLLPLHVACIKNDSAVVVELLNSGVCINDPVNLKSPFWPSYTPLHFAVEYGRFEIVDLLLKHGADISVKNLKSMTPLHLAVQMGDESIIDSILAAHNDYPKNINPVDNLGFSHFHAACIRSDPSVVEGFLKRGVEVNTRVSDKSLEYPGYTALHLAVQHEFPAIVSLLLKHKADVSMKNSVGKTALHLAIIKENRDIVDLILGNYRTCYSDLNPADERNFSHFHAACMRNDPEIVRFFLRNGVDVNKPLSCHSPNWAEYTPLHFAVENKCERTTKVLLQHGAQVEAKDAKGLTPLHLSVVYLDEQIATMLLQAGADVDVKAKTGITPLHSAVERGYLEFVELLLRHNANVNCVESLKFSTPLHMATLHKHFQIIDLLLANGANVHARERDGKTALHTMALRDPKRELDMELVQSYGKMIMPLLAAGCNIDAQDSYGRTALHMTCLYRNIAGAYALLQHGADINVEDNIGKTPLLYCMHVFHNIYYIFEDHIEKLRIINFPVSSSNEECLSKLKGAYKRQKRKWNEMEHDIDFADRCREELDRMKGTRIDNYWTLYNIIFRDANGMALHIRNETLKEIVESSDFDKTFALYGYLIKLQINRGYARAVLMGPAIESLHFFIGMELPVLCSETILKYLTNDHLKDLIKAKARMTIDSEECIL